MTLPPSRADDPLRGVTDPRLLRFAAYLEEKRAGRAFAARRDIDPLEIPYILGQVVMLDVVGTPPRFRYRLIGSAIVAWRGYDLTGKYLDEHPLKEHREFTLARYRETLEQRRMTGGAYDLTLDGTRRQFQSVRAPLSEDGETITMIIAAMVLTR